MSKRISLHIGVDSYKPAIGPLQFCGADATAVADALTARTHGFDSIVCTVLTDKSGSRSPTRGNIITALHDTVDACGEGDTMVVQFSGHGALGYDERLYLLPNDCDHRSISDGGIAWQLVMDQLKRSAAAKRIVLVDACHSGAGKSVDQAHRTSQAIVTHLEEHGDGFVCMASCSGGQLAYELPDLSHGIFSYYLANGILGSADPLSSGVIDVASLFTFVSDRTTQHAKRIGATQTPHLISKVSASLESFVLTAAPLDLPIRNVLVLSNDPVLGELVCASIKRSRRARNATRNPDTEDALRRAQDGFEYDAVYVDVESAWPLQWSFIELVRHRYPIVPFVLMGSRDEFLSRLPLAQRRRLAHYFFLDTRTPMREAEAEIDATLAQVEWDIATRHGEHRD